MMVDIGACLGRPVTLHRASRIPGEPVFSPSVSGSEITRRDARVGCCDAIKAREAAAALIGAHGEAPGALRGLWPLRSP